MQHQRKQANTHASMPTLLLPLLKPCLATAPQRHIPDQRQNKSFERHEHRENPTAVINITGMKKA